MYTSYKFNWILRNDDGFIEKASVRFLEGNMQSVTITKPDGSTINQEMYVPTARLASTVLKNWKGTPSKDFSGYDTVEYSPADFGSIKETDELRAFVNAELIKDTKRTPIPEQAVVDINTLRTMTVK